LKKGGEKHLEKRTKKKEKKKFVGETAHRTNTQQQVRIGAPDRRAHYPQKEYLQEDQ
jgi:hypothetical protein